jgi:Antitoxin SocA-like, Panacea domain
VKEIERKPFIFSIRGRILHQKVKLSSISCSIMTTFVFDINKTVAAAAYLAKKSGGEVNLFVLLKKLYAAERSAILEWHRPITGDSFCSMQGGIVLSRTYNLIKREVMGTESDMMKWAEHFSPRSGGHQIKMLTEPDFDYLSEREREALDKGNDEVDEIIRQHGKIKEPLHQKWPEWKNPKKFGKGSVPLDVAEILAEEIEDCEEIQRICMEIRSVQSAKAALQTN